MSTTNAYFFIISNVPPKSQESIKGFLNSLAAFNKYLINRDLRGEQRDILGGVGYVVLFNALRCKYLVVQEGYADIRDFLCRKLHMAIWATDGHLTQGILVLCL